VKKIILLLLFLVFLSIGCAATVEDVRRWEAEGNGKSLAASLRSKNQPARKAAAEALSEMGWQPKDAEGKIWFLVASENWDEVGKLGEPAIGPLIFAFWYGDPDFREDAAKVFGKLGEPAVEPLNTLLANQRFCHERHIIYEILAPEFPEGALEKPLKCCEICGAPTSSICQRRYIWVCDRHQYYRSGGGRWIHFPYNITY